MHEVTRYTRRERISRWFAETFNNAPRYKQDIDYTRLIAEQRHFIASQHEQPAQIERRDA